MNNQIFDLGKSAFIPWYNMDNSIVVKWATETFGDHVLAQTERNGDNFCVNVEFLCKEDISTLKTLFEKHDEEGFFDISSLEDIERAFDDDHEFLESTFEFPETMSFRLLEPTLLELTGLDKISVWLATEDGIFFFEKSF